MRTFASVAIVLLWIVSGFAQEPASSESERVAGFKEKFKEERDLVSKPDAPLRFVPGMIRKADEMAKKGDEALAGGRVTQALAAYRQARWQLPYVPPKLPENVARIIGNPRLRHEGPITSLALSPDGKRLATGSYDTSVKIWDMDNGQQVSMFSGHKAFVKAVAFSDDGKSVASAGDEADIKIWDPATGQEIKTLKSQGQTVNGLLFQGKKLLSSEDSAKDKKTWIGQYSVDTGTNSPASSAVGEFAFQYLTSNPDRSVAAASFPNFTSDKIFIWRAMGVTLHLSVPKGGANGLAVSPDGGTFCRIGVEGLSFFRIPTDIDAPAGELKPQKTIASPPAAQFMSAAFSKDGKLLATGCSDGVIRLWALDTFQPAGVFVGHSDVVTALVFTPAGNRLVSASADNTARVWDIDEAIPARDYEGHSGTVWSASFSPDGKRLLSASADKSVKIWDVATGKVIFTLNGHTSPVTVAVFSPDGSKIASGAGDRSIKIWDAASGTLVRSLEGHTGTITALDFSADGTKLVSGSADKQVKIWDLASGKSPEPVGDAKSIVTAVAFSPDGKQIAVGSVDQKIRLFDVSNGKLLHSWVAHGTSVSGLAFSPNGRYLASCGADQLVRVWPLSTPGKDPITLAGHTGPLSSVAFHPDSQHLVSAGSDRMVKLWTLEGNTAKDTQTFRGHRDWISSVAFSKDGYRIVSSGVDRLIKVWEITSRDIPFVAEHSGAIRCLACSSDGRWIATGSRDRTIKIWDRATGEAKSTLSGHGATVLSLAFTPDNKSLVSAGIDLSVRFWDVESGRELPRSDSIKQAFTNMSSPLAYVVVTTDGKRLLGWRQGAQLVGNQAGTVLSCFDMKTGKEITMIADPGRGVNSVAFSDNGKYAATGGGDGSLRLFDLEKNGASIPGGDWFVFDNNTQMGDIAFTPDGSRLVVSSTLGEIKILDVAKRTELHVFKGHQTAIHACMISPDAKRLGTVGDDNIIKLWDLDTAKELRQWDMSFLGASAVEFSCIMFSGDSRQLIAGLADSTAYVLDVP